jgi:hypothetical protein
MTAKLLPLAFVAAACALAATLPATRSAAGVAPLLTPGTVPCGEYRISGRFKSGTQGTDVLNLYPDTTAELPIAVLGVPADRSFTLDGALVTLEVSLKRVKGYPEARFVKYVSVARREQAERSPLEKIRAANCR